MIALDRKERLLDLMETFGLVGAAVNPGPSLTYLTGLQFHLMERPTVLLVSRSGAAALVLPELEKGKVTEETSLFKIFSYGDDPATWQVAFEQAAASLNLTSGKLGVEPTRLRFLELRFLEAALSNVTVVDGGQVFESLRICKNSEEIHWMKRAAKIAQQALLATISEIREGMTEKEIANLLVIQLLQAGSDPQLPFQPIVALGENSANPHAVPTDRPLHSGNLLLVDWGASFQGYFSDITRTFTFGKMDPELVRVGEIVLEANRAGRSAGKPGLDAGIVDRAARSVITDAGYGKEFIHRTGHGLGMEAHEPPYIYEKNDLILNPGMTFTVEPGIYLPGKGGVRIEDDVVVRDEGLESLTDLPRQVLPLEEYRG